MKKIHITIVESKEIEELSKEENILFYDIIKEVLYKTKLVSYIFYICNKFTTVAETKLNTKLSSNILSKLKDTLTYHLQNPIQEIKDSKYYTEFNNEHIFPSHVYWTNKTHIKNNKTLKEIKQERIKFLK